MAFIGVPHWVKAKILSFTKCYIGYTYTEKLFTIYIKFISKFICFILSGNFSYTIIYVKQI